MNGNNDNNQKATLKGNVVIPLPFWNGEKWAEWIPWDEV